MITVAAAEDIIRLQVASYGLEAIVFTTAIGRVLGEHLFADRDLPPCDRVTMDGIAIRYSDFDQGKKTFTIKAILAAGAAPINILPGECAEIMTGAALPPTTDTVIRYEDLAIMEGTATVLIDTIKKGQNIHCRGRDKKEGELVAHPGQVIDAATISMAASIGKTHLLVHKLPRVAVVSTGDELVDMVTQPAPWQVRRSNSYMVSAVLERYGINADAVHMPDNPNVIDTTLGDLFTKYDAVLLSGGVSMGKYDYLPQAMEKRGVQQLFHKVQQRPGKPFWFGRQGNGPLVFAFPGNPVSTFLCLHRYFIPWLTATMGIRNEAAARYAVLDADVTFAPALQYFVQVRLRMNQQGQLLATPTEGNGSGDYANLMDSDAFMELPAEESNFKAGIAYRIWPFKQFI